MKRTWIMAGISVLLLSNTFMPAKAEDAPQVVRAQAFELVDANGNVTASLKNVDGQPILELFNKEGVSKVGLASASDGSTILSFRNDDGVNRTMVGIDKDGTPMITLNDDIGTELAILKIKPDGRPILNLKHTANGQDAFAALGFSDDAAGLALSSGDKKNFALLRAQPDGKSYLKLGDQENNTRTSLAVDTYGRGTLTFFDESGKSKLRTGIDKSDSAFINFYDIYEKPRFELVLGVDEGGALPELRMLSQDGTYGAEMIVYNDGQAGFYLLRDLAWQASFSLSSKNHPELFFLDKKDKKVVDLSLGVNGSASFSLNGAKWPTDADKPKNR